MAIGRSAHTLLGLPDGRMMAIGGLVPEDAADCEDCETETKSAEIYDPVADRWTPTAEVDLQMSDGGGEDDISEVIALAGGQVLATGQNDSAALYDPVIGTWNAVTWDGGWGHLALRDGNALSFGVDYLGVDSEVEMPFAARFDPTNGGTSIVGRLAPPDYASTAVLANGEVFIAGGVVEDQDGYLGKFLRTAEIFDPGTGLRSEIASMPAARGTSTAIPLDDGSVLVVGGVDVWETQEGNDTPGCVPVKHRVVRWAP